MQSISSIPVRHSSTIQSQSLDTIRRTPTRSAGSSAFRCAGTGEARRFGAGSRGNRLAAVQPPRQPSLDAQMLVKNLCILEISGGALASQIELEIPSIQKPFLYQATVEEHVSHE